MWEATIPTWQVDTATIDADPTEAQGLDMAGDVLRQAADATVEGFIVRAAQDREPQPWLDASLVSNSTLRLSAAELSEVVRQVMQLLDPYRLRNRPDPGPEDRTVQAALRFVPIAAPAESDQAAGVDSGAVGST